MLVYNEKEQVEQKEIENAEFMEKKRTLARERIQSRLVWEEISTIKEGPNLPWNKDSVFRQDPTRERKRTFVLLNRTRMQT